MSDQVVQTGSRIVPTMRYRDAAAAVDWLCRAFGFERHLVVPGEDGGVRHAQLVFGSGMVMVSPGHDSAYDQFVKPPADVGGVCTQSAYIIVPDADAHYATAIAAGAEIVIDIEDQGPRGRFYSCRDPEGHIWNFGDYDPWATLSEAT